MKSKGKKKSIRLSLEGELTIKRATEIRELLLESLSRSQRVEVELGEVTDVDLSYLQLMCSAHRSASESGKSLILINQDVLLFTETKDTAGFTNGKECKHNHNNDCLWMEG